MDIPHLEQVLQDIQRGEIQVIIVESIVPSPVAQGLLMQFTNIYMYEWDAPRAERQLQQLAVDRVLLQDLLKDVALDQLLRPEAVEDVTGRLQHTASMTRARSADELAVILDQVGDLSAGRDRRAGRRGSDGLDRATGRAGAHPRGRAADGARSGETLGQRRPGGGVRARAPRRSCVNGR